MGCQPMINNKGKPPLPEYKRIPHYDIKDAYQVITYRLADSLPGAILKELAAERDQLEKDKDKYREMSGLSDKIKKAEALRRQKIEKYLDAGYGSCILQQANIVKIITGNWHFFDKQRYDLIAYVVMPNHVHVLIKTYPEWTLQKVVHNWKSYTAQEINKALLKMGWQPISPGKVWQSNYWDRFIRNDNHYFRTIDYIHNNPVKAGLCNKPIDWSASSIGAWAASP